MESEVVSLKTNEPISEENASKILDTLFDWYGIHEDDFKGDKDRTSSFKATKRKLIRAIREGLVEIQEESEGGIDTIVVYQNLKNQMVGAKLNEKNKQGKRIRYKEVMGRDKTAIKDEDETGNYSKMYQYLGSLSGYGPEVFVNLRGRDNSIAECLGAIFLLV